MREEYVTNQNTKFKFRIITNNVRGVGNKEKRKSIFEYHRQNVDILILQETHSQPKDESIWENEWGGKAIFTHGTSAARGIAIFMSKQMYQKVENIYKSTDGRSIIFDYVEDETTITIAAIYAPNTEDPKYFQDIAQILRRRNEHKIIIGDFNTVLDIEKDRKNTYSNNNKNKEEIENIMEEFSLKETWRERNMENKEYSWMKKGNINKASRIDYALISGGLDQHISYITYISSIMTDHRAMYMVVDLNLKERGNGYWKFNNQLLQNLEYLDYLNKEIEKCIASLKQKNPEEKWEKLKERIKKKTIEFSRKNTSEEKLIISQLSEMVNDYESRLPLDEKDTKMLEKTKEDLEERVMQQTKGMIFRSKVKWYEEGEKNTKYFYNLEKARYNAKTCFKLIDKEQNIIQDQAKILETQREFYKELYSKDRDVKFNAVNNSGIRVPEDIKMEQEKQISEEDLKVAIKTMKNNKSPGQDGLPVDFYKVFLEPDKNNIPRNGRI